MNYFSEITKVRLASFWALKRARISLILLLLAYLASAFSSLWIDDKPLYLNYKGESKFPFLFFYSAADLGGTYKTEANYVELREGDRNGDELYIISPIVPHNPMHAYLNEEGNPPHTPSFNHPMGTDTQGRDLLSRLVYGFEICMRFSFLLTLSGVFFGVLIGGLQGYFGGKIDLLFQRGIEVWSALPFLYVVIFLGSLYGGSFWMLLGIMSLFQWIGLSYYMRGEFFKVKGMTFIKSARSMGMPHRHIFFKEILPNAITPVITLAPFMLIGGIGSLTALDFLGFGLQPPTPSWGELLSQGLQNLYAWWIPTFTVLALFVTLLLTTFVGEGVREAFDPKTKSRGANDE